MRFEADRPIFQQIAAHVEDQVLTGALGPEARVPAVRELAEQLEVNPNTVVRSFLELEQTGVIFKKRGLGYFVEGGAKDSILERRRRRFLEDELPEMVRRMRLLGIGLDVVQSLYTKGTP